MTREKERARFYNPKALLETPVTDLELGITAGFMNFGGGLPDVHIFKFNADGQAYWINAVFGGRVTGPVWPADK